MELFKNYSLLESTDPDYVLNHLEDLEENLKIELYNNPSEQTFSIVDLDLTDSEINEILDIFESYDVLPDLDGGELNDSGDNLFEDYDF